MSNINKHHMRIKAFPTNMEVKNVGKLLDLLKKAIHEIQLKNNSGLSFEELYRNAYTLVLQKHGDTLYKATRDVVRAHMLSIQEDLLKKIGSGFLPALIVHWKEHQVAMGMIRDILMYMDRVYVPNHQPPVYNMGLESFRDEVLLCPKLRAELQITLLQMVLQDRRGELVDTSLIKEATQMLVQLGIDSTAVYEAEFETPLFVQTREFYRNESECFLQDNSSSILFIRKVNQRLEEEARRASLYLHASTQRRLLGVLEEVLIAANVSRLVDMEGSGLEHMLANERFDDVLEMYRLVKRCPERGLRAMSDCISTYLRRCGRAIMGGSAGGGGALEGPECSEESAPTAGMQGAGGGRGAGGSTPPNQYISDLLDLKEKFDKLLLYSLGNEKLFRNQINSDFEAFINANSQAPELLALFLDEKLRKSGAGRGISEQDLELVFDRCIGLFRYLQEKDTFERYYKNHLAKRLLNEKTQSDDQEKSMISKLKTECGCDFTSKLEGMFRDIAVSNSLMTEFNQFQKQASAGKTSGGQFDIHVRVLTTGVWPSNGDVNGVLFPREVHARFDLFSKFYLNKHCGRRLTLQPQMGSADLLALFGSTGNLDGEDPASQLSTGAPASSTSASIKRYILTVSTYQMIVLLKFNDSPSHSFQDLLTSTQIPEVHLVRALQSLVLVKNCRVLLKEPRGSKEVLSTDVFTVNPHYSSKHVKVKVVPVSSRETEPERLETRHKVDMNRNYVIEAAIMRVMKARREMEHNQLVAEVTGQLKTRFQPVPQVIKQRIENLLEREYLARKEDRRVYVYRA